MTKKKVKQNPEKSKPTRVKPPEPAQSVKTAVSPPTSDIQRTIDAAANLQQTIGNQAVGRLLIQPKLTVGPVGDRYEQEADAVAKQVVSQLSTSSQATTQRQEEEELPVQAKRVQRQEEDELEVQAKYLQRQEEDELQLKPVQRQEKDELQLKPVQRQEEDELQLKSVQRQSEADYKSGEISADLEQSIQSARGSGQPLADNVRTPMENAFGTDFSGVKVHTDSQSDTLNQSIQARAFTTGQDIFFRQGEYNPGNSSGKELLAHELTHVVQQGGATVQKEAALEKEIVQSKKKTVIQREFDVHFDVREPGRGPVNRNWIVQDIMADGARPHIGVDTMNTVNARQPNRGNGGDPGNAPQDLRHVISWQQIKQDVAALGGNTLDHVATYIDAHWPDSSDIMNIGPLNNAQKDDPRVVERYARHWAHARHDDPKNLFYGNALENAGLGGGGIDNPTQAAGPDLGAQGTAFTQNERRGLIAEQLDAWGITAETEYGLPGEQMLVTNWLTNHSTMADDIREHAVGQPNYVALRNYLAGLPRFRTLTLTNVYNH